MSDVMTPPPREMVTTDPETARRIELAEAWLKDGDYQACVHETRAVLAFAPKEAKALYLQGVALRYLGDLAGAEAAVHRLLDLRPDYGRAWQELGHLARARSNGADAAVAYEAAVRHNPALIASWQQLALLYDAAGQQDMVERAKQQVTWLAALPRELMSVKSFIAERRLEKAEALCRAFLIVNPEHVEAMRQLAAIGVAMNVLDDAEYLLESAHALAPDNLWIHSEYAAVLHRRQRFADAGREARRLVEREPDNPHFLTLLGNASLGVGDFDKALAAYDRVLAAWPQAETIHLSRGHALKTIGRYEEAVSAYRAAYAIRPDFGDAYWSLANLKIHRFAAGEITEMERKERAPRTSETDRIHLNFALGKAYNDAGDPARAFAHYERGNRLKYTRSGYDPARFDEEVERMIACTPGALFARSPVGGCLARDPIFIVGLPRAGSTLIEQILASHSMIEGTAELPYVLAQAHALSSRTYEERDVHYPANFARLDPADFTSFGEAYLAKAATHRTGKAYFIDKMPNNFRHLGLIARMLPNARIIDARREPIACCFSNYTQLFAEGQEFSYDLEAVGRYYGGYLRLMGHWHEVLPGRILTVRHETLIDDIEGQVRRLLDFVGVPFEDACLRFHETKRAVRTASSEQVRRPLNQEGRTRWRPFEQFLTPLKAALAKTGATNM